MHATMNSSHQYETVWIFVDNTVYKFVFFLFFFYFRATSNIKSDLPADGFDIVVTKHNYIYTVRSETSSFS